MNPEEIEAGELKESINQFVWTHADGAVFLEDAEIAAIKIFEIMNELSAAARLRTEARKENALP